MSKMRRREWLRAAGGAVALGLAGCTDRLPAPFGGFGGGDVPPYASWIGVPKSAPADEPALLVTVDLSMFFEFEDDGEGTETPTPTPTPTSSDEEAADALLRNGLGAMVLALLAVGFGLGSVGLGRLVDYEGADEPADLPADSLTLAPGVNVLSGSFDTAAVASDVEESGLEEYDSVGEFTIYYDGGGDIASADAVAVDGDHLLHASGTSDDDGDPTDPLDAIERAIETDAGDRTAYHEASDDVEWLLGTAGTGGVVFGQFTEDDGMEPGEDDQGFLEFNEDLYRDAKGVVHDLSVDVDAGSAEATAALVYADAERADTDRLKEFAGTEARDRDVRRDGERVIIEASYGEETVDDG